MRFGSSRFDVVGQLPSLRRYALALTHDEHDAEDLVQDALVRAYAGRGGYDASRDLRSWLLSIVHNVFVDGVRSRAAESARVRDAGELAERAARPAQDHAVRLAQVRASFAALPDDQRAALHLVAVEGLSYAEAAEVLGVPVGTLMSRLGRAREALRRIEAAPHAARSRQLRIVGGSDDVDA